MIKKTFLALLFSSILTGHGVALSTSTYATLNPKPPATISLDAFGSIILGPIETNLGGSGKSTLWPSWNPTSSRQVNTFGGVPPGYTYLQGVDAWSKVETSDGVYDWSLFDMVWAELTQQAVKNVTIPTIYVPQWASVGNAYSFACTITSASPGVVTATGNSYINGQEIFFSGGTVPTGLVLGASTNPGTFYYVVHNGTDGTGKFRLALTAGGADINTTGSAGTSTCNTQWSPPADMAELGIWVTQVLTRAALDGLPIKYVEGMNEPNNFGQFFYGSVAENVQMQQQIYAAAKAYDPTIKVTCPSMNGFTIGGTPGNGNSGGSNYLQALIAAGILPYCDIINFHGYPPASLSPAVYNTYEAAFKVMLAANGAGSLPVWNTEYNSLTGVPATDVTYLSWLRLVDLSNGVSRGYYYAWDDSADPLWCPPQTCTPNGALNVAGTAYQQIVNWLVGKTMTPPGLVINGVVMSESFTGPGGYQSQAVWTSDASTPNYTVPPWAVQYRTLAGGLVTGLSQSGATVAIGANPILFEN